MIADVISQNNIHLILTLVPGAEHYRTAIPQALMDLCTCRAAAGLDITTQDQTIQELFSAGTAPST